MQLTYQEELAYSNTLKLDKSRKVSNLSERDRDNFINEIAQIPSKSNDGGQFISKSEFQVRNQSINNQENPFKKLCSNKYFVNSFEKDCSDLSQIESTETVPTGSIYLNSISVSSKSLREVYVGNLPNGTTVSELLEYINRSIINSHSSQFDGDPVISAWINSDGKYAFCECRSIEEANFLLRLNNLLNFKGNLLKIGKPKVSENVSGEQLSNNTALINQITQNTTIISPYFNNIPLILKNKETILIVGIDKTLNMERIKEIFVDNKKFEVLGVINYRNKYKIAICELDPNTNLNDRTVNRLGAEVQIIKLKNFNSKIVYSINFHLKNMVARIKEKNQPLLEEELYKNFHNSNTRSLLIPLKPSRCILISKLLTVEELLIPNIYLSVHEEIYEKCLKYGEIYKIIIPKPEKTLSNEDQCTDPYFGRAFIFFFNVQSAIKAKLDLFKTRFLGRNIKISYYSEHEFLNGNLISCEHNRYDMMDDKELSKIINSKN